MHSDSLSDFTELQERERRDNCFMKADNFSFIMRDLTTNNVRKTILKKKSMFIDGQLQEPHLFKNPSAI